MSISVIYGVVAALSLLLLAGYCAFVKKKDTWLLLLFVSVFVVDLGYFSLSISRTLPEALLANRVAYLGSVFLPLCMLMAIASLCGAAYKRWATGLLCVSVAVFLLAASPGYSELYYKEVSLVFVDGAARLEKVYGPLHDIYLVYLLAYFSMMIITVLASKKKGRIVAVKHVAMLLTIVLLNIGIWFVEKLIYSNFEFLSLSYIISELLLLMLYGMMQDYGILTATAAEARREEEAEAALPVVPAAPVVMEAAVPAEPEPIREEKGRGLSDERIAQIMANWPTAAELTARERDVLCLLLHDKRRKDIAAELNVTEHTVKKHTANIFAKTGVTNRAELFEKAERETNIP